MCSSQKSQQESLMKARHPRRRRPAVARAGNAVKRHLGLKLSRDDQAMEK